MDEKIEKESKEGEKADAVDVEVALASVDGYSRILDRCCAKAISVLESYGISAADSPPADDMYLGFVNLLFNAATRPGRGRECLQEKMVSLIEDYLFMMAEEKRADRERLANMPIFTPLTPPGESECKHPGLYAMHDNAFPDSIVNMMLNAMSIDGMILCPHCRLLIPVEEVKDGSLWKGEE